MPSNARRTTTGSIVWLSYRRSTSRTFASPLSEDAAAAEEAVEEAEEAAAAAAERGELRGWLAAAKPRVLRQLPPGATQGGCKVWPPTIARAATDLDFVTWRWPSGGVMLTPPARRSRVARRCPTSAGRLARAVACVLARLHDGPKFSSLALPLANDRQTKRRRLRRRWSNEEPPPKAPRTPSVATAA